MVYDRAACRPRRGASSPRREHRPRCAPLDRPTGSGLSRRPRRRTMWAPAKVPAPAQGQDARPPRAGWRVLKGQSPWAGGIFNGGRNNPLEQDERGRRSNGCAVLHAHILRTVLTVMLLTPRRVASVEFVAGTITQRHGRFQKKWPPSVKKSLRKWLGGTRFFS